MAEFLAVPDTRLDRQQVVNLQINMIMRYAIIIIIIVHVVSTHAVRRVLLIEYSNNQSEMQSYNYSYTTIAYIIACYIAARIR